MIGEPQNEQECAERWVIDAAMSDPPLFAFCPLREDGAVLVGMTLVINEPPGPFAGVYHRDGEEAAEAWLEEYADEVRAALERAER